MQQPTTSQSLNRSISLTINSSDARAMANRTRADELKALWMGLRDGLNRRRQTRLQGQLRAADVCCQ